MTNENKQSLHVSALLGVALAATGILGRLLLTAPNFNPAIAIAIFAGYLIKDRRIALASVIAMMGVSDLVIGFYDWRMMFFVYLGFVVAWLAGVAFSRWIDSPQFRWKFAGVAAPAIISACAFFLITNSACCLIGWYPMSWSGLAASLTAGLPFFRSTLASTFGFSILMFGSMFAIQSYLASNRLAATNKLPVS